MNNYTPEQKAQQYETFKEVAESNLERFVNGFKSELWNYRVLNTHKICNILTDDETRQLAINYFSMQLAKALAEDQQFYFDKKLTVKI